MPVSRRLLLSLPLSALALPRAAPAAESGAPAGVVQRFCDELLAVMKQAKRLSFDQRYSLLAPAIARAFNLPLMSRLSVGPEWSQLRPDLQQRIGEAFARYTISVYANRFDDYGGERFEVAATPVANASGSIVQTWLVKANGEKVSLNYLMRAAGAAGWQIIDVYLSGTVSELATRRSEFASVLQRGGAEGLVRMLDQRSAELRTG